MAMDTSSEAAGLRRAFLAAMSGEERLREALELSEAVAALAEAGSRARAVSGSQADDHPESRRAHANDPHR